MQLKPTTAHSLHRSRLSHRRPRPRLLKSHPNWSPCFPSYLRLVWFPYQRGSLKLQVISHYFPHLRMDQELPVMFRMKPECLPGAATCPVSRLHHSPSFARSRHTAPTCPLVPARGAASCLVLSEGQSHVLHGAGSLSDANPSERASLAIGPVYSYLLLFFFTELSSFTFRTWICMGLPAYCLLSP